LAINQQNRKAPDQHPGPLILFYKITVPGIGQLSNFLMDHLLDFLD